MTVLAVDLGGSHATCGLVSGNQILVSREFDFLDARRLAPLLSALGESIQQLIELSNDPVSGIGLGFCGLVDRGRNRVASTNGKFVDAPDLDLSDWAKKEFGLPFILENDARLALRGEMAIGAAAGRTDVVMFTLGTGIGGVAAINGKPLYGRHGQAGVLLGHVPVADANCRCTCGGYGCAEAEASGWALANLCQRWPGFSDSELAGRTINFESLFALAEAGDLVAVDVRDYCLKIWGRMTIAAVNAFDPELVIFGGGVMGSAGQIIPVIEQHVHRNAWTAWGKTQFAKAALGNQAALFGVPSLFEERL